MKTVIKGREFKVKQTGQKFFYWSTRAMRWLPVKRVNVIFAKEEMSTVHARSHADTLAEARTMRAHGSAHARLLDMARIYRFYFAQARAVEA